MLTNTVFVKVQKRFKKKVKKKSKKTLNSIYKAKKKRDNAY